MTTDRDDATDTPEVTVDPHTPQGDADPSPNDAPDEGTAQEATPEDKPNRQAASYRVRLRETEAERDQLAEQVTALRRNLCDQAITQAGLKPAAVWASGTELESLLGDDGLPDPKAIKAAVAAAAEQLGIPQRPASMAGMKSGATGNPPTPNRWASAFAPLQD